MQTCKKYIATLLQTRLIELGINCEDDALKCIVDVLEKPPEDQAADFAMPCFRFAKALKISPGKIAEDLAIFLNSLAKDPWILSTSATNGFLNIVVKTTSMMSELLRPITLPVKKPTRVMIEYSQPNTHKDFHVGHLRNTCLGASLVHLFRYQGYDTIAANYFGDEGTHIAKCIWYIQSENKTPPDTDQGLWLGQMYTASTLKLEDCDSESKKTFQGEISQILKNIESKKGADYEFWKTTREWSLIEFRKIYSWLEAPFDHDLFESDVSEESQKIVDEYLAKKIFIESEGAIGIDLKEFGLGFMLARKRDGNTLYATKDLALARQKFEKYRIDRAYYIVANEQDHHFKQVFKTLEIMNFPGSKNCFHLSYGMVTLPDGKMSSRAGNTISFNELRQKIMAVLAAHFAKYDGVWSVELIAETQKQVAAGAMKYAMLAQDPAGKIVFDWEQWASFEGNTGPYLMYSYARTRSILQKAPKSELAVEKFADRLRHPCEKNLTRFILDLDQAIEVSCEKLKPSTLCHHLYGMAKAFNRFYAECPVLSEDVELTCARARLVALFSERLKLGLSLLGISTPEKM